MEEMGQRWSTAAVAVLQLVGLWWRSGCRCEIPAVGSGAQEMGVQGRRVGTYVGGDTSEMAARCTGSRHGDGGGQVGTMGAWAGGMAVARRAGRKVVGALWRQCGA